MVETYCVDEIILIDKYVSDAFDMYFGGCKICVLDIETTGLSPGQSQFVLGSLLSFEEDGEARLKQYFAQSTDEEKRLLYEYTEEARKYDVLLTYNGKHFDIPFLLNRANKHEVDIPDMPYNLDLYLVLNGYSSLRKQTPNLKQKTVEDFMGLWPYRSDKISGAESAMLYRRYEYLKENFEDAEGCMELMLLHNRDDVLQLGRLLPVLERADFHRAMHGMGFPVMSDGEKFIVESITLDKTRLNVRGKQPARPVSFISYGNGDGVDVKFEKENSGFEISFTAFKKDDFVIIDLLKLPFDVCPKIEELPDFGSGYLVLKNKDAVNYAAINYFIKIFLLQAVRAFR